MTTPIITFVESDRCKLTVNPDRITIKISKSLSGVHMERVQQFLSEVGKYMQNHATEDRSATFRGGIPNLIISSMGPDDKLRITIRDKSQYVRIKFDENNVDNPY